MEFKVNWKEINFKTTDSKPQINHISTREVIFNKFKAASVYDDFNFQLIPLFGERNQIIGTQLIECAEKGDHLIFENKNDKIERKTASYIPPNTLLEKQCYKIYRDKTQGNVSHVMASVSFRESLIDDQSLMKWTHLEIQNILEQAVRSILNSVVFDPIEHQFQSRCMSYFQLNSLGRSFETLNWFSVISIKGQSKELQEAFASQS